MRWIGNQQNIDSPDGEYIYGRIRDWSGTIEGTPVDEALYGDIHQLIARMQQASTFTPNGLPDNEYNGWQIFDAFMQHMGGWSKKLKFKVSQSGTGAPTIDNGFCNGFGLTINSIVRAGTGRYEFFTTGTPLSSAANFFAFSAQMDFGGTAYISWAGSNQFNIETFNAAGTQADNILSNTAVSIEQFEETVAVQ